MVELEFLQTTVMEGSSFSFQVCFTPGTDGVFPATILASMLTNVSLHYLTYEVMFLISNNINLVLSIMQSSLTWFEEFCDPSNL